MHSDCLGIVTIPEIYKYVTSLQILKSLMSKAGRGRGVLRPKWSWSTKGSVLYLALAIFVTVSIDVEWILSFFKSYNERQVICGTLNQEQKNGTLPPTFLGPSKKEGNCKSTYQSRV